jgi:TrmH family RNA methyltransferase
VITSHHNDTLKDIRRLLRRRDGTRFVAEGEDLLTAAAQAGWAPEVRLRAGVDVTEEALARVSALGSGTRELAVYEQRWAPAPLGPVSVYLHGVGDPGNVGTILRGALAFGAGSVVLGPGCADPFGPKAVRASMGAIFAVPVVRAELEDCPRPRIALVARAGAALAGPRHRHARGGRGARRAAAGRRRPVRGGGAHPHRERIPERRHGGDRRAVRVDP